MEPLRVNNIASVKNLILDVCQFLQVSLDAENLSEGTTFERQELIQRCRCVLEAFLPSPRGSPNLSNYLDMKGISNKLVQHEEYVDADNQADCLFYEHLESESVPQSTHRYSVAPTLPEVTEPDICPHEGVAAIDLLSQDIKTGTLWRKERKFFLEQLKQWHAGLMGSWLLLYSSDRDLKPSQCIDMTGYAVRPLLNLQIKDVKRRESCFEVVHMTKKSHQFYASSSKDMQHWVASLSQASKTEQTPVTSIRKLPTPPPQCDMYYVDVTQEQDSIYEDPNYPPLEVSSSSSRVPTPPPRTPCISLRYNAASVTTAGKPTAAVQPHAEPHLEYVYDDIGTYQFKLSILPEDHSESSNQNTSFSPNEMKFVEEAFKYDTPKHIKPVEIVDATLNYDVPVVSPTKDSQITPQQKSVILPPTLIQKSTGWSRFTDRYTKDRRNTSESKKTKTNRELANEQNKFKEKKLDNTEEKVLRTNLFPHVAINGKNEKYKSPYIKSGKIHKLIQQMEANGGVKIHYERWTGRSRSMVEPVVDVEQYYEPVNAK